MRTIVRVQSFRDAVRQSAGDATQSIDLAVNANDVRRRIVLDFMECRVWDSSALEVRCICCAIRASMHLLAACAMLTMTLLS
jgi:hypothetical protein